MATLTEGSLEDFPAHALLPKRETQVESFLRKYPECNGDNVVIAIFDTGVDPGAPGLKTTPSGQRKIVDLIDCTGCGDVDTSTVETVQDDGTITGKSGRVLTIPPSWHNPTGKYHVGIKSVYSLYPQKAAKRVQDERKDKEWDPVHKLKLAEAVKNLAEFNAKCSNPTSEEEKLEHEDLTASVEALKLFEKNYKDKGPFVDVVLFHDGDVWRACLDTSQEGHLSECQLVGEFRQTGDYARISDMDMVNFSINVYDEGNKLSIVTNSGSHGTHVACIAGAYFEDQPELNGLAPGAQIMSMQIGDCRLNGMETGTAMIRAMKCCIDNKVDVINMSYGESAKWSKSGRIFNIIKKMVTEHNIIFLSSAGNDGPALSTVGAPVSISDDIIGVGAYVSPDMMVAEYSLLEKMGGTQYTWSSNGPCADGKLGVCIVAPGGAVTSVPNWTLSKAQLMNGTSMSSPNACGSVAVLLSALKYHGIEYSPQLIRRCLENTALKIEGLPAFVQGNGMVQIDKAFEYMKETVSDGHLNHVTYRVDCGNGGGIYIREDWQHHAPDKYTVRIKPRFHKKSDNNLKIEFNKKVALVTSQSWITCASHLEMNNSVSAFEIQVKKSGLQPGCHYGEIQGFDLSYRNLGPLFRVPVTVIIPENISSSSNTVKLDNLSYQQGGRKRWFYSVPKGTCWAKLRLNALGNNDQSVRYVVHALQLVPESAPCQFQYHKYVTIDPSSSTTELVFKVKGGYTMELSIARWWRVAGDSHLSALLSFHGLCPEQAEINLHGGMAFARVDVTCPLVHEQISPVASLNQHVIPLTPKENSLKPLSDRDVLPDGEQVYALELTYNFHLPSTQEVTATVPLLRDVLYESQFESQFWMIYDTNKSLKGCGDALNITRQKYFYNLDKGDYVIKLQIRHSDYQLLDRLKDIVLSVHISVSPAIAMDAFSSRTKLFESDKKKMFPSKSLCSQNTCPVYLTPPPEEKFPKGMKPGEYLVGKISYSGDDAAKKVSTFPLMVSPGPSKVSPSKKDSSSETKSPETEYTDAHRDFLVTWITKLDGLELQSELLNTFPDDIALQNALLNSLDESKNRTDNLEKIVATGKQIIGRIDQKDILAYTGMKVDPSEQQAKKKKEMDKQKEFLVNALYKTALAIADGILTEEKQPGSVTTTTEETEKEGTQEEVEEGVQEQVKDQEDVKQEDEDKDKDDGDDGVKEEETDPPPPSSPSAFQVSDFTQCYRDMLKFVDASDTKMLTVVVRHGLVHKKYGRAIKALMKYFETNSTTKALYEVYIKLAQNCGWDHVVDYLNNAHAYRFPNSYQLF